MHKREKMDTVEASLAKLALIANESLRETFSTQEALQELRLVICEKKVVLDSIIERNMTAAAWVTVYETLFRTVRLVTRKLDGRLKDEFCALFETLGRQMGTVQGSKEKRKICHESIFLSLNLVINIAEIFLEDNDAFVAELKDEIMVLKREIKALSPP